MENKKILEYALLILVIALVLVFALEFRQREAGFCRLILNGLVNGSVETEEFIDWEKLVAIGVDVGKAYRNIADPVTKLGYRREFIRSFAVGFKSVKGDVKKFTNWRVLERKRTKVVVAADYLLYNKTILFTLSKLRKTKLIGLEWKQ
jgi:hypothetical protein